MRSDDEITAERIWELADDEPPEVVAAVEVFTVPCRWCVPGARKQADLIPFYFYDESDEYPDGDEVDDDDD